MNNSKVLEASQKTSPVTAWCRLFRYHLERGTGKTGTKWRSGERIEWTVDDFVNAISDHFADGTMLSNATFESWKHGRTLPRGSRRAAMFKVFWPNINSTNRIEMEEFRNALARAAAEHKVQQTPDKDNGQLVPLVPEPRTLSPDEKRTSFVQLCERIRSGEYSELLQETLTIPRCLELEGEEIVARISKGDLISELSSFVDCLEFKNSVGRHAPQVQAITFPIKLLLSTVTSALPHGTIIRDQIFTPDLVAIAPGAFKMGAPFDDPEAYSNELPEREVEVTKGFLISRYPVTFCEYDLFARARRLSLPHDEGWGREMRPVIHVSWKQAKDYADWLTELTHSPYRFCSEAEWEFAARAGFRTKYFWGDKWDPSRLNSGERFGGTTPVGSFSPNAWGLYDVLGNVWEWVEDDWFPDYAGAPQTAYARLLTPRSYLRCLRGGSWDAVRRNSRISDRCHQGESNEINNVGVRLARDASVI